MTRQSQEPTLDCFATLAMTRNILLLTLVLAAGCRDAQPPLPTTGQSAQLNEAEAMLNELGNEKGPGAKAPDPFSNQD